MSRIRVLCYFIMFLDFFFFYFSFLTFFALYDEERSLLFHANHELWVANFAPF